jgi:hypothetical protein
MTGVATINPTSLFGPSLFPLRNTPNGRRLTILTTSPDPLSPYVMYDMILLRQSTVGNFLQSRKDCWVRAGKVFFNIETYNSQSQPRNTEQEAGVTLVSMIFSSIINLLLLLLLLLVHTPWA